MRKIDKLKQIEKANILAEQRFMEAKGFSGDYDDKHPDAPWNELPEPENDDNGGYDGPDPELSVRESDTIKEDFSDGDADDAAFQDYYKSFVGDDEGQFFSHFNTKQEALTAILGMTNKPNVHYKPYILSGVILAILGKIQ